MPRLSKSEIHSDFSSASETWSEYRAQVIAFYDNYPHSELNDHITREFNKKIRDLGQDESLYISPYNAGLRYIGDGVFTVDPLSFNPYFYIDAASSMLGVLESPSLDLNPAVPSTLDIITATRAGTATYTDASGNIQTASPNTVRVDHVQGEELTPTKFQRVGYTDFSQDWKNTNTSDVAGSGYTGEASRIVTANSNTAKYWISVSSVNAVVYTLSFYIRRISGSGTISAYHASAANGNQTDITVTSEWTRQQVTFTGDGGNISAGVRIVTSGDQVEIAMPQVEEGAITDFVANTTGSPKYFAAATYAPRVPMILVEPAATNTAKYSEDVVNFNYSSGITHETTNILAPNGQASAFKITPDGSNSNTARSGSSYVYSGASYNAGDIVTMSVWLKADGYDYFVSVGGFFGGESALFDTIDGSNVSNDANVISASSEDYGNGWYRYKVTYTFQNQINNNSLYAGVRIRKRDASGNPISNFVTGETTGILVYGIQFELGSVATSYIPTSGSTVTRAADDLAIDGSDFTNFYNQSEGTVYVEYEPRVLSTSNTALEFSDGSANNRIFSLAFGAYHCYIIDGGVNQAVLDGGTNTAGVLNRLAFSYEANNIQASLDGGAVVSDTSASIPTVDRLILGNQTVSNTRLLNGHIKRVIYWPHHSDNI